jgi:hypothetical protein
VDECEESEDLAPSNHKVGCVDTEILVHLGGRFCQRSPKDDSGGSFDIG